MKISNLIDFYKNNYKSKIFKIKMEDPSNNAYIMYLYQYEEELENFKQTFLKYLPFYVRNSDYLSTLDETKDLDLQLENRSKNIRKSSKMVPSRTVGTDGIYGELFLDFYLKIVGNKKAIITYAIKRPFMSDSESKGPDNVVYYVDNQNVLNVCFCEAKFVGGAANARNKLIEDIVGTGVPPQNGHINKDYLNDYLHFIVEKGNSIEEKDKKIFCDFLDDLTRQLDCGNDFISVLKSHDICVNFIFFAIFNSTKKNPEKFSDYYNEIYSQCIENIKDIGLTNYKIEIVFIPTDNKPINIKKEIVKIYE